MGSISLYQILLIFAAGGFVYLIYLRGNRKNKHLHTIISQELEAAINPIDKLYKNLGGTIGYKAFYTRNGYINKVVALFTTLPRHSVAVYPFHLIFGGHDKLQLNIYTDKEILLHFICVKNKKKYLKLLSKYNISGLKSTEIPLGNSTYLLYYKNKESLDICNKIINTPFTTNLIAMSAIPENKSFFLYCIPKEGNIKPLLKKYLSTMSDCLIK